MKTKVHNSLIKKSILCLNKQGQKQIVSSQFVVVKYDTEHRFNVDNGSEKN
jgi:hypothetical protein